MTSKRCGQSNQLLALALNLHFFIWLGGLDLVWLVYDNIVYLTNRLGYKGMQVHLKMDGSRVGESCCYLTVFVQTDN